jgi:WD repeat-containing protein 35
MQQPEDPREEHIFCYRTKSQRDTIQILKSSQLQDAFSYIEDHSHPELWRILAEHALEKLDLSIAEKVITSFLYCY